MNQIYNCINILNSISRPFIQQKVSCTWGFSVHLDTLVFSIARCHRTAIAVVLFFFFFFRVIYYKIVQLHTQSAHITQGRGIYSNTKMWGRKVTHTLEPLGNVWHILYSWASYFIVLLRIYMVHKHYIQGIKGVCELFNSVITTMKSSHTP